MNTLQIIVPANQPGKVTWMRLLDKLERMVSAANSSGLRYRSRRGRGYMWMIYPREYLQLTQQLGRAPEWVRAAVREVTK